MEKNVDQKGRWRDKTIGFRVSNEENEAINEAVALSGLTKQDYITAKLLNRDVIVCSNPRTYKMLKDKMEARLNVIFCWKQYEISYEKPEPERMVLLKEERDYENKSIY